MTLRQHKRFRELPLLINSREIETGIQTVIPTAGKDDPMGVDVPVMIAVCPRTVDLLQRTSLPRLQVKQPLLTLLMPDREVAIVHQCKEDIFPIIGRTRPCQALPHCNGIEQGVHMIAIGTFLGVKGYFTEVVFLVFIMGRVLLLLTGQIIQCLPIR